MCNRYQWGDSETTKIIKIEHLVIAIEVEQVSASEDANIDKFTRFQIFAQIAIKVLLKQEDGGKMANIVFKEILTGLQL